MSLWVKQKTNKKTTTRHPVVRKMNKSLMRHSLCKQSHKGRCEKPINSSPSTKNGFTYNETQYKHVITLIFIYCCYKGIAKDQKSDFCIFPLPCLRLRRTLPAEGDLRQVVHKENAHFRIFKIKLYKRGGTKSQTQIFV